MLNSKRLFLEKGAKRLSDKETVTGDELITLDLEAALAEA